MTLPHLRPRGFSELIDATFQIVRARFGTLATGAALLMLPAMAFSLLLAVLFPQGELTLPAGADDGGVVVTAPVADDPSVLAGVAAVALGLAMVAAYVVGFGALVHVASKAYLGEEADLGSAFALARRRSGALFRTMVTKYFRAMAVMIIAFLGPMALSALGGADTPGVGMILFTVVLLPLGMVLATMLLVRWAMTAPVVMVEQVSGREALARSARLTDGSSWRLFAIFLVLFVLVWVVMMMALGLGLMVSMSPVYAQVLSNLASLVTYPFAAVLLTVIYYDLRIRNEGFDLELMAAGLGDGAARAAGGTMPSSPPSRQPA